MADDDSPRANQRRKATVSLAAMSRVAKLGRTVSALAPGTPLEWTRDVRFAPRASGIREPRRDPYALVEFEADGFERLDGDWWPRSPEERDPELRALIAQSNTRWANIETALDDRTFVAFPNTFNRKLFTHDGPSLETLGFPQHMTGASVLRGRSYVPATFLVEDQVAYVFRDPRRFLLVAQYIHADATLLAHGRAIKPVIYDAETKEDAASKRATIEKRYALRARMPEEILDAHFALHPLEMYTRLAAVIHGVPRHTLAFPIVVIRGQLDTMPWIADLPPVGGAPFPGVAAFRCPQKFISTSITSTALSYDVATQFTGVTTGSKNTHNLREFAVYFVFHVASDTPWLYVNQLEHEVLLPPGTRWILRDVFESQQYPSAAENALYFHIAVDMAPLEFS